LQPTVYAVLALCKADIPVTGPLSVEQIVEEALFFIVFVIVMIMVLIVTAIMTARSRPGENRK